MEGPTAPATGPAADNLVLRAARALAEVAPGLRLGQFRLIKTLPVAAGLGVALMATLGNTPEGLEPRYDLPRVAPLPLALWARQGVAPVLSRHVSGALRRLLAESEPTTRQPNGGLVLAKGA